MPRLLLLTLSLSVLVLVGPPRPAAALTLTAEDQGGWACCPLDLRPFGSFTGVFDWVESRSYFVFDTTPLAGPVSAATLRLWNPVGVPGFGGFLSPDPEETLTLFDVTTAASWLGDLGAPDAFGIWVDLGSGTPYGSVAVSEADEGRWVEVTLNEAGLAALNARIGTGRPRFALATALTTLRSGPSVEYIFSQSGEDAQLVVSVPEMHAAALLAGSVAVLALARRRTG